MSDDRIILRSWAGTTWMYGTPWHGEAKFARPVRTPLRQIFFLRHATTNEIVPLRCAEALARFLACSFVPFYSRSGLDFALTFFSQLIDSLPCAKLRFVPEERAIDLVRVARDMKTHSTGLGFSSMWPLASCTADTVFVSGSKAAA